jgi:hypothetical protein
MGQVVSCYLPLTTCYLLLTTYYLLLATCYLLLINFALFPILNFNDRAPLPLFEISKMEEIGLAEKIWVLFWAFF